MIMRKLTVIALPAIFVGAVALFFAPNSVPAGQDNVAQTAAAHEKSSAPSPAQIGRGAKKWVETCAQCHNLRDPKEFSDKNWDVIVNHMRTIGPLPGETAADIKAFLKSSN